MELTLDGYLQSFEVGYLYRTRAEIAGKLPRTTKPNRRGPALKCIMLGAQWWMRWMYEIFETIKAAIIDSEWLCVQEANTRDW